jgi:hypothetical protein
MSKEDKEWEEILGKYQNEHASTERYSPVPNNNGPFGFPTFLPFLC